jgi:hypothetical protein
MKWSLLVVALLGGHWGEVGHRLIGAAAAAALPAEMPAFFRASADELSYLNPEPDRWRSRAERSLDPAEDDAFAPDHYIDLERVPPGALDARDRFAYLDSLRAHGVDAAGGGLLPFRILELTQRLREEFRLWRAATDTRTRGWIEARIINDAGILGHYVADGSNPHHTTIHYDGWIGDNPNGYTTARGFHARFESIFVETHFAPGDITVDSAPRIFNALRPAILGYLRESNALVPRLYDLDKRARFDSATTDAVDRQFAAERLVAGARMLRDIWWTAWVTSGQTIETAESVIAHDVAARGGIDRIHALRTVRQIGLLVNGKDTSRLVIESKLPDVVREEITQKKQTLVRAYDGRTGWQQVPGSGTANLMTPAEQRDISHEADVLTPLVDYTAKGNRVALLGIESVEGRDAYKVQVTLKDSTVSVYDIDRETWLPVRWQGGPWETFYRSFIDIGGVKFPSRIETVERETGTAAAPVTIVITSGVANPSLSDARFAAPASAR